MSKLREILDKLVARIFHEEEGYSKDDTWCAGEYKKFFAQAEQEIIKLIPKKKKLYYPEYLKPGSVDEQIEKRHKALYYNQAVDDILKNFSGDKNDQT